MKNLFLLFCLLFSVTQINGQELSLEKILQQIPRLTFEKIETTNDYQSMYKLMIRQPLDHLDSTKGFFHQKVYLSHKNFDRPTVMVTEGYQRNRNRIYELTQLLNANQIQVEHRYFGESMPDSLDYRYLNLKQITADLHHIRQLFDEIYLKQWISTGISKGGATSICYRYFYPEDIDVSVPYVAPINKSYEEKRIYDFLDKVGPKECRDKIKAYQIALLKNSAIILPLLKFYSMGARATYSYQTLEEAFEYGVMEYPFSFWQWGGNCEDIPSENDSVEEMLLHFISIMDITSLFSDEAIRLYTSHYYQSATEMGYYGYETSKFKDYLVALPTDINPQATFFGFQMTDKFNGQLLNDLNSWLEEKGNKMIYIYGSLDPWTASAVIPSSKVDSKLFILEGKHHGNARIKGMTETERKELLTTLEKWLDIKIQ